MSKLREAFEKGEFAITAEMAPPKGTDLSHLAECAKLVIGRVHAANVTDNQSAVMRTSSLATCKMLKDLGLEPVIQMTGRDRNRIAIESEMLSAGFFGIDNLLALTGDHVCVGDHKQAKPVFDLDAVSILSTATMMNNGTDSTGLELKGKTDFFLGACVTPEYDPIEVIEEGEEGYYTNMVHLMYNVFGKQIESNVSFNLLRSNNNTTHKNT